SERAPERLQLVLRLANLCAQRFRVETRIIKSAGAQSLAQALQLCFVTADDAGEVVALGSERVAAFGFAQLGPNAHVVNLQGVSRLDQATRPGAAGPGGSTSRILLGAGFGSAAGRPKASPTRKSHGRSVRHQVAPCGPGSRMASLG